MEKVLQRQYVKWKINVPNTSATGGYLTATTQTIEGIPFRRFIGSVLVGVSGLQSEYVRPSFQINPPPMPDIDINWIAYNIVNRQGDFSTYQKESADGLTTTQTQNEECDIAVIFYGPDCLSLAAMVRDAFDIPQNQETLQNNGMAMIGTSDIIRAPELINDRYFDRADMTITIRREIRRDFSVLSFADVCGNIAGNRYGSSVISHTFEA